MSSASTAGEQLYRQLAELLAPPDSLEGTAALVILEPAGKGVATVGLSGDPSADEALADLANVVPAATGSFVATGEHYDQVWDFVINAAMPTGAFGEPAADTVARLIERGRTEFALMGRARTDNPTEIYHPVRASPTGWLGNDGWSSVSFRVGGDTTATPSRPEGSSAGGDGGEVTLGPAEIVFVEPEVVLVEPQQPGVIDNPLDDPDRPIAPELVMPDIVPDLTWHIVEDEVIGQLDQPVLEVMRSLDLVSDDQPAAVQVVAEAFRNDLVGHLIADVSDAPVAVVEEVTTDDLAPALTDNLRWRDLWTAVRAVDEAAEQTPVAPTPSGFELSFDYRIVGLHRRWLWSQLLHLSSWTVPGLPAGGISNGKPLRNPGLMPLVTTRMLVVRNLVVKAQWSEADKTRASSGRAISFGPFGLSGGSSFDGTTMSGPDPQVVAWLATVVPACPAVSTAPGLPATRSPAGARPSTAKTEEP